MHSSTQSIFLLVISLCTFKETFTFRTTTTTISKRTTWGTTSTSLSASSSSPSEGNNNLKIPHPPNNPPPKKLGGVPYFLENESSSIPSMSSSSDDNDATNQAISGKDILEKGSSRVDNALPRKPKPPNSPPPSDILQNSYFSNAEGSPTELVVRAVNSIVGPLFKSGVQRSVSKEKIAGVALVTASYGLISTMSLAASSAAALGAAYVAIHPGAAGDLARLVGSLTWTLGKTLTQELNDKQEQQDENAALDIVNLSVQKPIFSDEEEMELLKVLEETEKAVGLAVENEKQLMTATIQKETSKEKEVLELAVENDKKLMEKAPAETVTPEKAAVGEKRKSTKKKQTVAKNSKLSTKTEAVESDIDPVEEARIAEEKRLAVIARLEEEKSVLAEEKAEKNRIAAEKTEVDKRLAQEAKVAEDKRLTAEKAKVEVKAAKEAKIAQEKRVTAEKAEAERIEYEKSSEKARVAEEKQIAAKKEIAAEEKRLAEQQSAAEKKRQEDMKKSDASNEARRGAERIAATEKAVAEKSKARREEVAKAAAEARLAAQQRLAAEETKAAQIAAATAAQEDIEGPFIDEEDWNASIGLAKQLDPDLYGDNNEAATKKNLFDVDVALREKANMEMVNTDVVTTEPKKSPKRATIKDFEKLIGKLETETKHIEEGKRKQREEWDSSSSNTPVDDNFGLMTVAQLKEELRNQGLRLSGRKAELIERLRS